MKYKSDVLYFKDGIVDIPDGYIITRHVIDQTPPPLLPLNEKLVVLVPIIEE